MHDYVIKIKDHRYKRRDLICHINQYIYVPYVTDYKPSLNMRLDLCLCISDWVEKEE